MRTKAEHGFTLLELLVAIGIFSVLSVMVYSTMHSAQLANERSSEHARMLKAVQKTFTYMERDIMQMAPRQVRLNEEAPNKQLLFSQTDNQHDQAVDLLFTRRGWDNPLDMLNRGTVQAVGYRLNEERFERLYYLYPDAVAGTEPRVRTLISPVSEFTLRFYDGKEWLKNWSKEGALPKAVEVSLTTDQFGRITRQFLVAGAKS